MRKINVIKGDMMFQWKYGFYFLYGIMLVIYFILFSFVQGDARDKLVDICVYSDPAAMGMFFMGAILLLEKSQHVISSVAVSPMTVGEYIFGKIASIGIISLVVGMVLVTQGHTKNYLLSAIGIVGGSFIFSLCGVIVGTMISSINQYVVATIPFEIIGFVPVILYRLGVLPDSVWMLMHPGCAAMEMIEGNMSVLLLAFCSLLVWLIVLYYIAEKCVRKMLCC